MIPRGDAAIREGRDESHGFQGTIDLFRGGGGVLERLGEVLVDPIDLPALFATVKVT